MEDDQQFCLRWNNHQATLISVFDKLLEKGIHVDCTLAAEGQTLKAHKVVLSACSPYFESVLSQQYDKHPIIILKDVKYAELKAMMDYMYRGEVNISQDQLAALLKAAESLQIKGLSDNKPPPTPQPTVSPQKLQQQCESLSGETEDEEESLSCASSAVSSRKRMKRSDSPPPQEIPTDTNSPTNPNQPTHNGTQQDDPPTTSAINDVVQNFQWHMERNAQDEFNQDGQRDSQGIAVERCSTPEKGPLTDIKLRPRIRSTILDIDPIVPEMTPKLMKNSIVTRSSKRVVKEPESITTYTILTKAVLPAQVAPVNFRAPTETEIDTPKTDKLDALKLLKAKATAETTTPQSFIETPKSDSSKMEALKLLRSKGPEPCKLVVENDEKIIKFIVGKKKKEEPDSKGYKCPNCAKCYSAKKNLVRHMTLECGVEPRFQCPKCPSKRHRRNELKKHIQKKHKEYTIKDEYESIDMKEELSTDGI